MFGGIHRIVKTLSSPIVIDWNGIPLGVCFEFVTFQSDMNSVINENVKKRLLSDIASKHILSYCKHILFSITSIQDV